MASNEAANLLPVEVGKQGIGGSVRKLLVHLIGRPTNVRGEQNILEPGQRVRGRHWLFIENVKTSACNLTVCERRAERTLIDDGTACGVDQVSRRLHEL